MPKSRQRRSDLKSRLTRAQIDWPGFKRLSQATSITMKKEHFDWLKKVRFDWFAAGDPLVRAAAREFYDMGWSMVPPEYKERAFKVAYDISARTSGRYYVSPEKLACIPYRFGRLSAVCGAVGAFYGVSNYLNDKDIDTKIGTTLSAFQKKEADLERGVGSDGETGGSEGETGGSEGETVDSDVEDGGSEGGTEVEVVLKEVGVGKDVWVLLGCVAFGVFLILSSRD